MNVDQLRKELHVRGISCRGLEADLIEQLNKACEDKVPLINKVTISVGSSGFDERAKWIHPASIMCFNRILVLEVILD